MRVLLVTACLMFASGCASITDTKLQPVSVTTIMDNKEVVRSGCTLTNDVGKWFVTTPGSVTVHKSTGDLAVDCSKDNVGAGTERVVSKSNVNVWGNLLVGGLVGYVVDRNTGAGFDYPPTITVTLRPYNAEPGKAATPDVVPTPEPVVSPAQAIASTVPVPVTVAAAPPKPAVPFGQDSFQVQKLAKASNCAPDPLAILTAKGPGFENYSVKCSDGDALVYRCEFGNCRVLK